MTAQDEIYKEITTNITSLQVEDALRDVRLIIATLNRHLDADCEHCRKLMEESF
jgi:hypothetical protein